MREETRQVTIEKVVYIADDGAEFENEDDCAEHEIRLLSSQCPMYDYKRRPCDSVNDCWYVNLRNWVAVETFIKLCTCECISYNGIEEPGVYMYTENHSTVDWTNISKIVQSISESEDNPSGN